MNTPYKINKPKGLDEWVIDHFAKSYILVDKKKGTAICQKCGEDYNYIANELKHNQELECDGWCYSTAIVKEKRYGRKNLASAFRLLWFTRKNDIAYAQYDEIRVDYTGDKIALEYTALAQYRYGKKETIAYVLNKYWSYNSMVPTFDRCNPKLPHQNSMNYWSLPEFTYTDNLEELQKTTMKYADLIECEEITNLYEPKLVIEYLEKHRKYASVEKLRKAGFEDIVTWNIQWHTGHTINWRGKNLPKILKLSNMQEVRWFKNNANTFPELEAIHCLKKSKLKINEANVKLVKEVGIEHFIKITTIDNPTKIYNYISKENNMFVSEYIDYYDALIKLGVPITKNTLYPKNFEEAHDRATEGVEILISKEKSKEFKQTENKIITKTYEKELIIRAAAEPEELIKESKELSHCVRTYIDRVARGVSAIAFVRETSNPDKSFFTVEISPKRELLQIRGNHNCIPTPEVTAAVDQWIASMA
ncbi:MAG: PcfJ domain-containing protein [Peptostreptococcaceae bacterium]|nr:PcfJ domain-containing protein [Peptostreptococcaceae bacterium]